MADPARVRAVTTAAMADVTPPALREQIRSVIEAPSATPGAIVLACSPPTELDRRVAGVQLVYGGLWATRELIVTAPWDGDTPNETADLKALAANTMVARGFELLAATAASVQAVKTVQTFARSQRGATAPAATLEVDALTLAVVAGCEEPATTELTAQLEALVQDTDGAIPEPEAVLKRLDGAWTETIHPGD